MGHEDQDQYRDRKLGCTEPAIERQQSWVDRAACEKGRDEPGCEQAQPSHRQHQRDVVPSLILRPQIYTRLPGQVYRNHHGAAYGCRVVGENPFARNQRDDEVEYDHRRAEAEQQDLHDQPAFGRMGKVRRFPHIDRECDARWLFQAEVTIDRTGGARCQLESHFCRWHCPLRKRYRVAGELLVPFAPACRWPLEQRCTVDHLRDFEHCPAFDWRQPQPQHRLHEACRCLGGLLPLNARLCAAQVFDPGLCRIIDRSEFELDPVLQLLCFHRLGEQQHCTDRKRGEEPPGYALTQVQQNSPRAARRRIGNPTAPCRVPSGNTDFVFVHRKAVLHCNRSP